MQPHQIEVLDLFSAAAGGWSLGMHRAGFKTMAACEFVEWRREIYSQNNPGVRIYDDVCTLTADRILRDFGRLPSVVVGSPPCQDISSANTKGKGVEGARSGLYFEAIRIIGECRPRWFALENSSNLRTRGADAVLAALEELGYTCWTFVVRAGDIGANHERPRSWLIGCDLAQVTDTSEAGHEGWSTIRRGWPARHKHAGDHAPEGTGRVGSAAKIGPGHVCEHGIRWPWSCDECDRDAPYAPEERRDTWPGLPGSPERDEPEHVFGGAGNLADPDQARQADGCMVAGVRQAEIADDGRCAGRGDAGPSIRQMAVRTADCGRVAEWRTDWSLDDLAAHLQLDDGLSAWVAGTRIAVGGPKGTSAASLIVEAFGDAVVPQIPEAIGRAILRTERALAVAYGRAA
ncbi:DNA cytosine methyltransferase [Shinella sp. AETb1-6]|nr:DNA cytosine methyltransferase [Shinella sp. AETb1-6]MXN51884.1 DNA cytosine methyltransferase [Shinella sp. AETb1-6]